jgi:hypothetical protein
VGVLLRFEGVEMGRKAKKRFVVSGNEAVFRGSVQHLRAGFPGEEERPAARAEFELFAKTTKLASTESKRLDTIEWDWNQGWE